MPSSTRLSQRRANPCRCSSRTPTASSSPRRRWTAARSDARTTREIAAKVRGNPAELASFDPFFTFLLGGVAVFEGETRIGTVRVSGRPGKLAEQLALQAIERTTDPR